MGQPRLGLNTFIKPFLTESWPVRHSPSDHYRTIGRHVVTVECQGLRNFVKAGDTRTKIEFHTFFRKTL